MEIRKIRPADAEKFVEFYEKLVKESDYLMFTAERNGGKKPNRNRNILRITMITNRFSWQPKANGSSVISAFPAVICPN